MSCPSVARLARVELRSRDPSVLAAFYVDALGARIHDGARRAEAVTLRMGSTTLALRRTTHVARSSIVDVPGWDPRFQHCALRVDDVAVSHARLCRHAGWRAISRDGPERLPPRSGDVAAFKFRDLEGHPLELLELDDDVEVDTAHDATRSPSIALDHSAISVVDAARSIAFYESLGLSVRHRGFNVGIEQDRLDDVDDAHVEVVVLGVGDTEPHLELLCYRGAVRETVRSRGVDAPDVDDLQATRLVFELDDRHAFDAAAVARAAIDRNPREVLLRDPDGHLVALELSASVQ